MRSAVRFQSAAYWASWADSLPRIREKHPALRTLSGSPCSKADFQKEAIFRLQQLAGNDCWRAETSRSPENKDPIGNVGPALTSRRYFSRVSSGPSFHRPIEPSSDPNVVHLLASCSIPHPWWSSRVWNFGSSGSAPSSFSVPSPAVPLTFVATIGQFVGGCWVDKEGGPIEQCVEDILFV